MIRRDGTGLMQLTTDPSDEVAPCWSPDGKTVAYSALGHRTRRWEIWTLNVDKPGVRRFLTYGMFPAWSPDGTHIAFQRARQRGSRWFSIWTIDVSRGEALHPTEIAYSDTHACIGPAWAPDARTLVYSAVRPDAGAAGAFRGVPSVADLWALDLESGLKVKLTDSTSVAFNPVWSPNGRIFFVSGRSGTDNIWSISAQTGSYGTADGGVAVSQAAEGGAGR
jgi:Tol biopolymer transport system component